MQPRRYRNIGKPPRNKDIPLGIIWANGMTARHTYTAGQLRWSLTGSEFDVAEFWRADGLGEEEERKVG